MTLSLLISFIFACGGDKPEDTGNTDDTGTETTDTADTEDPQPDEESCDVLSGGIEPIDEETVEFWTYTLGGYSTVFHAKGDKPEGWPGGSAYVNGSDVFEYMTEEDGQHYWSKNSASGGTQYFAEPSVMESADLRILVYDADNQLCGCSMVMDLNDSETLNCDEISEDLNTFNPADYEE